MSTDSGLPNSGGLSKRKLPRLRDYDYTQAGWYFVTICTSNRECLFGTVSAGEMRLNQTGKVVAACWCQISEHFPRVGCDVFCVMPNHLHGVLTLAAEDGADRRLDKTSLSVVVGTFKAAVSRQCAPQESRRHGPLWQRSYYEHVIRTDDDLTAIRQYIVDNPLKWDLDEENPQNRMQAAQPPERAARP